MGITVHTGVGRGAVLPGGRQVKLSSFVDYAFVTPGQYKKNEPRYLTDHAVAASVQAGCVEQWGISDMPNYHVGGSDSFVEQVFGKDVSGTAKETLAISDDLQQTTNRSIQGIPFADGHGVTTNKNTDTIPVTDKSSHP